MSFASLGYANSLAQIKQSGVLRVGTTGDYPPLTFYDPSIKQFSGSDIQAAYALAKFLGVKVQFIKTTWPDLAKDLLANKFDIAMGGISASKDRAQQFLFSTPVQKFGKVPLIRCQDIHRYTSLATIDLPNVIVVENTGGANLKFAQTHLKQAKLIIVPQNKMTFDYLLKKKADVMFTDTIEAVYRHQLMPKLYVINLNYPLTREYKVYMVEKTNRSLWRQINRWLRVNVGIIS